MRTVTDNGDIFRDDFGYSSKFIWIVNEDSANVKYTLRYGWYFHDIGKYSWGYNNMFLPAKFVFSNESYRGYLFSCLFDDVSRIVFDYSNDNNFVFEFHKKSI